MNSKIYWGVIVMMKKVAMIAAAAAMVLPLGIGDCSANNEVNAFAAAKPAAKKLPHLISAKAIRKQHSTLRVASQLCIVQRLQLIKQGRHDQEGT